MEVISQTLLPTLSAIREICRDFEMRCPIKEICPGSDEFDFEPRETCVTCWYQWITSEACKAYYEAVSSQGMPIVERDQMTLELTERIVRPPIADFEKARVLMIAGFRAGIPSMQSQWRKIAEELVAQNTPRKDVSPNEHIIRKDLHADAPADRDKNIAKTFAQANADALRNTPATVADNGNTEILMLLAKGQQQIAAGQQQTNELLTRLIPQTESKQTNEPNFGEKMAQAKAAKKQTLAEVEKEEKNDEGN